MGGDHSSSKSSRRKKLSDTSGSSSNSEGESQEKSRRRRRRRRREDRPRSSHGSRGKESEAAEKSKRRKSRRDKKERRKTEQHRRKSSRENKKDVSDSDGCSSSSDDLELKVVKPEKVVHYILKKFSGVADDLRQLLQMIDDGQAVDTRGISNRDLVKLLKKLFLSLCLKQKDSGVFFLPPSARPTMEVVGSLINLHQKPVEHQLPSTGLASGVQSLPPEIESQKTIEEAHDEESARQDTKDDSSASCKRRFIGPEMPSAELLAAAAKLTDAETMLREAELEVDNDVFIGPAPPAVVAEAESANEAERFEEKFIVMASSTGGSASASSPAIELEDAHNPLWRYVTKQQKLGEGGGNVSWQCNFCHQTKRSSYTRVRAHLIHEPGHAVAFCPKVKSSDIAEMKKLEEECNERLRKNAPKKVSLPTSSVDYESKKRKMSGSGSWSTSDTNTTIGKSFNLKLRDQMDAEIARMFYASGLPFHLARSPYYVSCIQFAANNALPGYVPPGYNKLRTSLLQQERAHVDRLLQPIKGTWKEKGVSIVSDGWSDSQRRPLINFMAVTESGPMFLKAVDCTGEIKDKYFIFGLLKEVIEEVGPQNVIQVITDNAKNCAGAGHLIEAQFENIVWTPCVVHTLNLALQNICMAKNIENNVLTYEECRWITDLSEDVLFVKNFIMNHSMRLAIFNEFVPLKLLSVASTRFASVLVMLKRFKLIKGSLQAMVISERWNSYREDDKERAKAVKDFVLDDLWWDKMTYILSFTAPIYDMLRVCDTDKPCLHLVYDMWDTMIEKVKGVIYRHEGKRLDEASTFYEVVHKILVDRWNKNNTPLHCLAHSLNPRYYSEHWLHEDPSRVAPHRDMEVARERMKILKKYFPNLEERKMVITEFADFSSKSGEFADTDSIRDRYEMDPKRWWVTYGACAPFLQTLAFKLLVQPSSSSCAERNWSTYSFVHSLRRNKMTPKRAEDLVFIHSNLRLLSRRTPQYMKGETKMWDIAGDAFDSFEDAGELEIAQLSLDEPELEAVFFREDGDGGGPSGQAEAIEV